MPFGWVDSGRDKVAQIGCYCEVDGFGEALCVMCVMRVLLCMCMCTVAESARVSCLSLDADLETFKVGRNIVTS